MNRPLLITDCDEVLLHMVSHFKDWLNEVHDCEFAIERAFAEPLKRAGVPLGRDEIWPLLEGFFETEMDRQTLVPGARAALDRLGEKADIVVLTNLGHQFNEARSVQLAGHGIRHRVETNQGGKGDPVARLVAEFEPTVTVFVDDLGQHHESVARAAPDVWRLHMIAEPIMAKVTPPAAAAHARIDDWADAVRWIEARFAGVALDETMPNGFASAS